VLLAFSFACEGPAGENGENGSPGEAGPAGPTGTDGTNGADGSDGADGTNGADGANGADGMTGADGTNGMNGADSVCAGATPLEITAITVPEKIYEFESYLITPETNAADASALRFAVAGAGLPVSFTDNLDGTFSLNTNDADELDAPAHYSVTATDGCTVATGTFSLSSITPKAASVTIINLTNDTIDAFFDVTIGESSYLNKVQFISGVSVDNDITLIKVGATEVSIYANSFSNDVPEDYDAEDFIGSTDTLTFEQDKLYVIYVLPADEGVEFINYEVGAVDAEPIENASLTVAHFSATIGPVDVIDIDTGAILIDDLESGTISDALEVTPMTTYNLGVDIDQDAVADVELEFVPEAGIHYQVSARSSGFRTTLGLTQFDGEGFDYDDILTIVPPIAIDEVMLPFELGGYQNNEDGVPGDPSTNVFVGPEGTTQITVTFDFVVENFWDELVILDSEGNEVYRETGEESGVEVTIPGPWFSIGVDSDGSSTRDGYTIQTIVTQ